MGQHRYTPDRFSFRHHDDVDDFVGNFRSQLGGIAKDAATVTVCNHIQRSLRIIAADSVEELSQRGTSSASSGDRIAPGLLKWNYNCGTTLFGEPLQYCTR